MLLCDWISVVFHLLRMGTKLQETCGVRVKVVKNKVAPPFRKAEFEITFGEGISKIGEIVDLGVQYDIIQKWRLVSYNNAKLAQGRETPKALLKDNPELCEELKQKSNKPCKTRNDTIPVLKR